MGKIKIDGIALTPLKIVKNPKGDIFHGIRCSEATFQGFGEAYFSSVEGMEVKGWNKHQNMTLNLVVPVGRVGFVVFDDRASSTTKGQFFHTVLSLSNYQRLTISAGLWLGFKGLTTGKNLILNVASLEHDPTELEKCDLDAINFDWNFE